MNVFMVFVDDCLEHMSPNLTGARKFVKSAVKKNERINTSVEQRIIVAHNDTLWQLLRADLTALDYLLNKDPVRGWLVTARGGLKEVKEN